MVRPFSKQDLFPLIITFLFLWIEDAYFACFFPSSPLKIRFVFCNSRYLLLEYLPLPSMQIPNFSHRFPQLILARYIIIKLSNFHSRGIDIFITLVLLSQFSLFLCRGELELLSNFFFLMTWLRGGVIASLVSEMCRAMHVQENEKINFLKTARRQ